MPSFIYLIVLVVLKYNLFIFRWNGILYFVGLRAKEQQHVGPQSLVPSSSKTSPYLNELLSLSFNFLFLSLFLDSLDRDLYYFNVIIFNYEKICCECWS